MDTDFLQARITKTKELIVKYEDAIDFLITNPTKSYNLNTGQDSQSMTRQDLEKLQDGLDELMNRLIVYEARLTGNNSVIGVPGW